MLLKLADLTKDNEFSDKTNPSSSDERVKLDDSLSNSLKAKAIYNEEISARINQVTSLKESEEVKMLQEQINEKNKVNFNNFNSFVSIALKCQQPKKMFLKFFHLPIKQVNTLNP